jgi:hypothetical protein
LDEPCRIAAEKKKSSASRELKQREQSLFLDGMRIDVALEEQIKAIKEQANLTATVERQFVIAVGRFTDYRRECTCGT